MSMKRVFQINHTEIKSIYVGEDLFSISRIAESDEEKFINFYKYPEMLEKTDRFKYEDIKEICFKDNELSIKANRGYIDGVEYNEIVLNPKEDTSTMIEVIESVGTLLKVEKPENRIKGVLNSAGFGIFLFATIFVILITTGNTDFSSSGGRAKNRLIARVIDAVFQFLGPTVSLILFVLLALIGVFFMWKKYQKPSNSILFESKA